MKRRMMILLLTVFFIWGLGVLCQKISYDPAFSVVDAFSSATQQRKKVVVQVETELGDETSQEEET